MNNTSVRQPRRLNSSLVEICRLRPTSLQLTINLKSASTAQMTLTEGDFALNIHDFVELYTARGSAGIFRVTSLPDEVATSRAVTLMHAIDTLSDNLWKAQLDYDGTVKDFLTKLLAQQVVKRWQLGAVDDTAKYKRSGINYDRLSDLFNALCEERIGYYPVYDFTTTPWTLSFKKLPATVAAEFRLTRNVERCRVTRDDGEQCTRLHLSVSKKTNDGTSTTLKTYNHAEAQRTYGIIEKAADIDAEDVPNADTWAADFLAQRAYPSVQITIDGYELTRLTGESFDTMAVGKLCRAVLPKRGSLPAEVLEERIVTVTYPDAVGQPTRVTVELANHLAKFSEGLASMERQQRQTQRSARSSARASYTQQQQQTSWSQVVQRYGEVLDETGLTELHESGIVMDPDSGVRLHSLFQGDGVSGQGALQVSWDKIQSVVEKTGIDKLGKKETLYSKITQTADRFTLAIAGDEYDSLEDFLAAQGVGSVLEFTQEGLKSVSGSVTAVDNKLGEITGSTLWQTRDSISTLAGRFTVSKDGNTVKLVDGAQLKVTKDGVTSVVGTVNEIKGLRDEITGTTMWQDRDSISTLAGKFTVSKDGKTVKLVDGAQLKVTKDNVTSVVGTVADIKGLRDEITGTTIWQDRDSISTLAGKFTVSKDGKTVNLVDGAQLKVTKDGVSSVVGTVKEISAAKKEITGTTFWQNRTHIGNVAGKFKITSSGHVVLEDGANMYVTKNGSYIEVVDKGSVVSAINATKKGVLIEAEHINLSGYVTATKFEALDGKFDNLVSGHTKAGYLWADDVVSDGSLIAGESLTVGAWSRSSGYNGKFTFRSTDVSWKSKKVCTGITITAPSVTYAGDAHWYKYKLGTAEETQYGRLVTSFSAGSVSPTYETIYYLGSDTEGK